MTFQRLPVEIQCIIVEHLMVAVGPLKAVQVRLVNKCFSGAYLTALLTRQTIDFEEPAIHCSLWYILPCSWKASTMLARANQSRSFLFETIKTLDGLMDTPKEGEQSHFRIAEAAAHFYSVFQFEARLYNNDNTMVTLRGQNTLCGAIILGNLPLVQALVRDRTDMDVNVESACFGLPLHLAAAWGHAAIVQHLLNSGANPCALSHGAKAVDPLSYDCPVSRQQHIHCPKGSALSAAAGAGHYQIVQQLLSLAPDRRLSATSPEYFHAIVSAAQGGHTDCIELLVRFTGQPLADLPGSLHELILWAAARGGHLCVAQMLLDDPQLQLDVDAQRYGRFKNGSALHIAASRGDEVFAKALVERYGADVDLDANEGFVGRPYDVAARAGHRDTLDFLLSASKDKDAITSAFQSAARGAQVGILAWLVARYGREIAAKKAYPDEAADNNDTVGQVALSYAIMDPAPGVILFLVREAGVSLDDPFWSLGGRRPVAVAKTDSSRWIVDLLLRLGAEDVTVNEDDWRGNEKWESFTKETGLLYTIRGVRVSERTWQWV